MVQGESKKAYTYLCNQESEMNLFYECKVRFSFCMRRWSIASPIDKFVGIPTETNNLHCYSFSMFYRVIKNNERRMPYINISHLGYNFLMKIPFSVYASFSQGFKLNDLLEHGKDSICYLWTFFKIQKL